MMPLVNSAYDVYVKGCAGYVMFSFCIFPENTHRNRNYSTRANKGSNRKECPYLCRLVLGGRQKPQLKKHINVVNFVRGKGSLKCSFNLTLSIV